MSACHLAKTDIYRKNSKAGYVFPDFLQFENDWSVTNRERGILTDKSISGSLTTEEQERLDALQIYADYHIERIAPRPTLALDEFESRLFSNRP